MPCFHQPGHPGILVNVGLLSADDPGGALAHPALAVVGRVGAQADGVEGAAGAGHSSLPVGDGMQTTFSMVPLKRFKI